MQQTTKQIKGNYDIVAHLHNNGPSVIKFNF